MMSRTVPLWSAASDAEEIVQRGRHAHVAVHTARGPHTTPVAVAWSGDTLWFITPRRSVKARAAQQGPVSALLEADGRALAISGHAVLLDPLRPRLPGLALPRLPVAALRYLERHGPETLTLAREALGTLLHDGDLSGLRPRVVVGLMPTRAAVVAIDAAASGVAPWAGQRSWTAPIPRMAPRARAACGARQWADRLPHGLGQPVAGNGPAVLTLDSSDGPLPLPARWHGHDDTVRLSPGAAELLPERSGRLAACVTLIAREEPGLRGKAGVLLRGSVDVSADRRTLRLAVERLSWWQGMEAGTVRPAELEEVRRHHVR